VDLEVNKIISLNKFNFRSINTKLTILYTYKCQRYKFCIKMYTCNI